MTKSWRRRIRRSSASVMGRFCRDRYVSGASVASVSGEYPAPGQASVLLGLNLVETCEAVFLSVFGDSLGAVVFYVLFTRIGTKRCACVGVKKRAKNVCTICCIPECLFAHTVPVLKKVPERC